MLVLLPLRLWASALMPAHLPSHAPSPPAANAKVECHSLMGHALGSTQAMGWPSMSEPLSHAKAQGPGQTHAHGAHPMPTDLAQATGEPPPMGCHEGSNCAWCGVCHSPAGLLSHWSHPAHPTPHTRPNTHSAPRQAHGWPPLIKPPIA
jgi:hypothetical protein